MIYRRASVFIGGPNSFFGISFSAMGVVS